MSRFDTQTDLVGREDATIPEVLRARVLESGSRPFLLYEDQQWTYQEAWIEICGFARFLLDHCGDTDSDRVACYLSNQPRYLWAWLGSQVAGKVFVTIHRSHRGQILQDMLARSKAGILVTEQSALANLDTMESPVALTVLVDGRSDRSWGSSQCLSWPEVSDLDPNLIATPAPSDVSTLVFTSGSTGRSKAVPVPHNQYCRGGAAVASAMKIGPDDCFHAWLPLSHVGGQLDVTMAVVVGGARMALIDRFSASRFWDQISRYQATLFAGFTNLLEILMQMPARSDDRNSGLRAGLIGFVPSTIRDPFEERYAVDLFDVYGMTEAEPIALPSCEVPAPNGSCGLVNPDFEAVLLDEDDRPVSTGSLGEIAVRPTRPNVMFAGYEDDEEATKLAFRNGWFHTGDLGWMNEDGFLFFKERKRALIRRRGENISSWELESIISGHPGIRTCAALGVPSPLGEDDVKVVVVLKPRATLTPKELVVWCRKEMAPFMVPRFVEFVSSLPLTNTGKVQKELLRSVAPPVFDSSHDQGEVR